MTDAGELNLTEQSYYEEAIGETAYNSCTNVLYVFPDHVCEQLLPVIRNRYITTAETISYENARELERIFSEEYPETADTGVSYSIRLSTLQINSTKANNFILQAAMLYGAVVLMVICLTILSLQQLLDADQYHYRFSVLRKLGVEEPRIGKLILKQLGVWFGLPIIVAVIVSTVVIAYFVQTISAEISAYIGFGALMLQTGITVGILALLFVSAIFYVHGYSSGVLLPHNPLPVTENIGPSASENSFLRFSDTLRRNEVNFIESFFLLPNRSQRTGLFAVRYRQIPGTPPHMADSGKDTVRGGAPWRKHRLSRRHVYFPS